MEFLKNFKDDYRFSLRFEVGDLYHTIIEVSFDGLAYRFPKNSIVSWLTTNNIRWDWHCRKTEIWQGEPHAIHVTISSKPPIISFKTLDDAFLFKITWEANH